MTESSFSILLLIVPVIIAGCLHMVVVTYNLYSFLAVPIDEKLLGRNKTLRGFIVVPLLSTLVAPVILNLLEEPLHTSLLLGFSTGWGYMLGEIPNSFFKRKIGVPAGVTPTRYRLLFIFFDQADSALGVLAGCSLVINLNFLQAIIIFISFIISAILVKNFLYALSLKKTRF